MIDPVFRNINKLLVFSFKNGETDAARDSFDSSIGKWGVWTKTSKWKNQHFLIY